MLTEIEIVKYIIKIQQLDDCSGAPKVAELDDKARKQFLGELELMTKSPEGSRILNNLPVLYKRELMKMFPVANNGRVISFYGQR